MLHQSTNCNRRPDERPTPRLGRPRARARLGLEREPPPDKTLLRTRQSPASPTSRNAFPIDPSDHEASSNSVATNASSSSSSARKRRSLPVLVTHSAEPAFAILARRRAAARLEGSKGFTKDLCRVADIPTAAYGRFMDRQAAKTYLASQSLPIVVKADGLAAGKGVIIADDAGGSRGGRRRVSFRRIRLGRQRKSSSRNFCKAKKRASSRFATASTRCRSPRLKITSASATATPVRTPAAWAPIRRLRS